MSDTQTEETTETATELEPDTLTSPDGTESESDEGAELETEQEQAEPIEPDDDTEEAASTEEAPEARGLNEKELKARDDKIDKENLRHVSRVSEIMGDDSAILIQCPVCMDGIAGWIYPPDVAPLPPEAIARIRQVVGLPDYSNFQHAVDAVACPDCDGLGEVITGSKVPGYETKTCSRCNKQGYIITMQTVQTNGNLGEPAPIVTGPTVYEAPPADPEVAHLRERGFTVIPPMQPVNP